MGIVFKRIRLDISLATTLIPSTGCDFVFSWVRSPQLYRVTDLCTYLKDYNSIFFFESNFVNHLEYLRCKADDFSHVTHVTAFHAWNWSEDTSSAFSKHLSLMITAALSSNLIVEPSARRILFVVRTTTARTTDFS